VAETPAVQAWVDYYAREFPNEPDKAALLAYARNQGNAGKTPPTTTNSTADTQKQVAAIDILKEAFNQYGLSSLIDDIDRYIQQGYTDPDTIELMLAKTDEYKKRFAGNEMLRQAGKNVLSIGEYLSVENQMQQNFKQLGLPEGLRSKDYIAKIIGSGTSVNEATSRAKSASDMVYSTPASVRNEYLRLYGVGVGDLAAAFLDPAVAEPIINERIRKSTIGGAARDQGVQSNLVNEIASATPDITYTQAAQGFAQAQQEGMRGEKLSQIYGDQYGIQEATQETFGLAGAAKAETTKKKLASKERAAFSGSSGIRAGSLAQDNKSL
jgi:hypothetical protein